MRAVISLWLSLVLVVLALGGCGGDGRTPQEHIAAAVAFEAQGELDPAIQELKSALQQSPDNSEARFLLGTIQLRTGDTGAAAKELMRSYELGYDPEQLTIPLANALLAQGEFQSLLDVAEDLPNMTGDAQIRLLVLRGHAHVGLGELDEGDALYDMAMSLKDDTAEARLGKAQVQANRGNLEKAREWIAGAVEADPKLSAAWSLLGDLEQFDGNLEAAEVAYSEALKIKPEGVHELASRALVLIALDKMGRARKDVEAAMRLNTRATVKQPLAYYAQGQLRLKAGRLEQAIQSLEKMLEYAPNFLPARYYLGIAHYRLGNLGQADQYATLFRNRAPRYPGAHRLYAAIRYSQGEFEEAREVLENLLSFIPEDTWSLALLSDIALTQGDASQSVEGYRQLVDLYPDSVSAHRNLALGLMVMDPDQARQVLLEQLDAQGDGGGRAIETKTLVLLSYLRAEQWEDAIAAARDLIADDDKNWDAYTLLAGAFVGKGDSGQAREAYRKALELRPGNINAANNLARMEVKAGNLDAARELYEDMQEHNPDAVAPVLYLNALDQQQGRFEDAQARLEDAISRHPGETALKLALARLYLTTGQPSLVLAMTYELDADEAESPALLQVLGDSQFALGEAAAAAEAYEKLVRQAPDVASFRYLLGRAYASSGRLPEAYEQLQEAVHIDPEHYASKILRIQLLRLENKVDQASQLLESLDSEFADRPEVLVEKGWLALYRSEPAAAREAFNAAFERAPINDLVVQLGVVDWSEGKPQDAIARYRQWLEKNPDDATILIHLANTYLQLGMDSEAVRAFERLRQFNPDNPVVLNNLAWLLRSSDPGQALEHAERAVKFAPDWGAALDTLGSIQLGQGDLDRAERSFEQALTRSPGNPDIRYHLAVVASRRGDNGQAATILRAILADRDTPFASRAEAELLLASLQ